MISLSTRLHALLPQTQCTRCGYADCAAYADALASGEADLNQCAPGGTEGIVRLAAALGQPPKPLNPDYGTEKPRVVAVIDENWCIGCTKCLDVCPTDAILGASKRMHTVMSAHCTGCELCIPVCPVDCIETLKESGTRTGWAAWSDDRASQALARYRHHSARHRHAEKKSLDAGNGESSTPHSQSMHDAPEDPAQDSRANPSDAALSSTRDKHALIAAAMKRARALKTP